MTYRIAAEFTTASEIAEFDLCQRKWAFKYVEGLSPPSNASAALGTRVHWVLEAWLRDGTPPDTWTEEGEIAASGLHLLPAPRYPGLEIEANFRFTSKRAWYSGTKDFRYRDADGLLHIGDHKTTKSFQWAKTAEEIIAHPQAVLYAADEFRSNPDDNILSLDWVYYRTKGARVAKPVTQLVTRETIGRLFFEAIEPVAERITLLHHSATEHDGRALDLPGNFFACDAYGGCPFLGICNPTATQRVQAQMTQANETLADKLRRIHAAAGPNPLAPPPQGAPVPPLAAAMGAAFSLPVPAPPVAPPRAPRAPAQAVEVIDDEPATSPPVAPIRAVLADPPVASHAAHAIHAISAPSVPTESAGYMLYVGCMVAGVDMTNALDYIDAAHAEIKANVKADDGTPLLHYRMLSYGKGPALLCLALESVLDKCNATPGAEVTGDIYLGDTEPEKDTAALWISRAARVVRAVR